jgi:hypothetical protein
MVKHLALCRLYGLKSKQARKNLAPAFYLNALIKKATRFYIFILLQAG